MSKIDEYIIVHDELKHPKLLKKQSYNWRTDIFDTYKEMVIMMNNIFHLNILNEEYVYILSFDWEHKLKGIFELSHGNTENSIVSSHLIYCFLLLTGADNFVIMHNHTTGLSEASTDDMNITHKLLAASTFFDIELLESIIVNENTATLIKENKTYNIKKAFW